MAQYFTRRFLQALPVLLAATVLVFLVIHLIPGDPAAVLAGPNATPQALAALRTKLRLDEPPWQQYLVWLGHVLRGDLGVSYINQFPVIKLLAAKLPATAELAITAILFATVLGIPLGVLTAVRPRGPIAVLASIFNAVAMAVPTFWLGILLVLVLAVRVRVLPASGYVPFFEAPLANLRFILLPTITLGMPLLAVLSHFVQATVAEVMGEDYVRTAIAKGLPYWKAVAKHALRNALIPTVTVLGIQFGNLLAGAVMTEAIFGWPGLGGLILYAITTRDYTVVQGTILLFVTLFVFVNLAVDLVYAAIDPRIRIGGRGGDA